MRRIFERIYPYVVGGLSALFFQYFVDEFPSGEGIHSATITLGAILTGFLATVKSIAISTDNVSMRRLKETKFFPLLISYLREAIYCALLFSMLGLIGFFQDYNNISHLFGLIWFAFVGINFGTFIRVTHNLINIIAIN